MKFITFEGIEGCGKSTQSKKLHQYFLNENKDVVLTREPGGTKEAETIREILIHQDLDDKTEVLLNFAARNEHVTKLIKPALDKGQIVISDRFFDSTYAYQGYAMSVDLDLIDNIKEQTINNFVPDITFLIDVDVTLAFERISNRSDNNKYENFAIDFHQKVRDGFLDLASQNDRIKIIDGSKNEEEVFAQILTYLP
ncbi:MAG: dTMP kinase [Rickettsiales bacterium]|nr:dTMP kinase [Rickettsiales bacterium]